MFCLVDNILQGHRLQNLHDCILNLYPYLPGDTIVCPYTVARISNALGGDDWPLQAIEAIANPDLSRRLSENISSFGASHTSYDPFRSKNGNDLFKVFRRDFLVSCYCSKL